MDYKVLSFVSKVYWSKKECLEELADYLSENGFIVSDIEKTWVTYGIDKQFKLRALILGYYK